MNVFDEINIGVDLDGVTADFCKRFSEVAHSLYTELPIMENYSDIKEWDWETWYCSKIQLNNVWSTVRCMENFWTTLEVFHIEHFEYFRKNLMNLPKVNVYFITARMKTMGLSVAKQSTYWLKSVGWENPCVLEIFDKGKAIKSLNISHFVDDRDLNIQDAYINSDAQLYLYDAPYNQKLELPIERFCRVKNLTEFTEKVLERL
jgi:uncharacterized HAD superfamily protein